MPNPDGHVVLKKVMKDGEQWCPVVQAAHYLRTTTPKIRSLIGSSQLRCTQIRKNGAIYINVGDLVRIQKEWLSTKQP